jgi:hypothetical protein
VTAPEHAGRVLDWRPRYDEKSRGYPMAAGDDQLPATGVLWRPGRTVLDQGREGACVGFAAAAELMADPVPVPRIGNAFALGLYRMAQRRDQWPGENYSGTSVLAGVTELKARGYCTGYRWAFSAEQLVAGIVTDGPAIVGVEWRVGSYVTDSDAVLRPSGRMVGGHALCMLGAIPADAAMTDEAWRALDGLGLGAGVRAVLEDDDEDAAAIGINSWGLSFGARGLFVVPMSVLREWCAAGWEAAQLTGRQLPPPARRGEQGMPDETDDTTGLNLGPSRQQAAESESTETLELPATELRVGDRLFLSDDVGATLERESATITGLRLSRGVAPRVLVSTRSGSFPLGAGVVVKVRRAASD